MRYSSDRLSAADDQKHMRRALFLARKGRGLASPNPSVGCVIVQRGEVVGEGFHIYDLRDHAEVRAIMAAGGRSAGTTAYITLEPCSHHGRTPPCTKLLIEAGVRRAVVSLIDPNPKVSGAGMEALRAAGISVEVGLMQAEASELIEPFACHVRYGHPLVVSKAGMSLDGRIATWRGENRWITSEKGRLFGQSLRFRLDSILVGVGTILSDDPELSYRLRARRSRPLLRVVLDSRLRTPPNARIFKSGPADSVLIFCRTDASTKRRARLEKAGACVVPIPHDSAGLSLPHVLHELGQRDILGLLVEGGASVHWSFANAELVDKFYFVIAPFIIGGVNSIPSIGGTGYDALAASPRFKIRRMFRVGCDLVLETFPSYSRSMLSPWHS